MNVTLWLHGDFPQVRRNYFLLQKPGFLKLEMHNFQVSGMVKEPYTLPLETVPDPFNRNCVKSFYSNVL